MQCREEVGEHIVTSPPPLPTPAVAPPAPKPAAPVARLAGAVAGGTMGTVSPSAEMLPHYAVIRGQSMSALTRATGQYRTPLLSVNIVPVWSP